MRRERNLVEADETAPCSAGEDSPEHKEAWTGEVDRLFSAALNEMRRQAERALAAAEQRRAAEITELSHAIKKQHAVIEALRQELAEAKEAEALRLSEAQQKWEQAQAERLQAARQALDGEKEELTREANRHRSVAEQLADQLAAMKARETTEQQFWSRLKEISTEVERSLLRARAEWETELARLAGEGEWRLPSFLTKNTPSTKGP